MRRLRADVTAEPFVGYELRVMTLNQSRERSAEFATVFHPFEHTGQEAGTQRAVCNQADSESLQRRNQFDLDEREGEV